MHMLTLAEHSASKGDGDEIARLRDVRSDYGLLKQHG